MWAYVALFGGLVIFGGLMIRGIIRRRQDRIIHAALRAEAWERIKAGRRARRWW
jgi:hypothetical protein